MIPIGALANTFYKDRKLMRILAQKPSVRIKEWARGDSLLEEDYLPYITPVSFFNPSGRRLLNPWFGDELQITNQVLYESAYAVGEPAQVPVPAGEIWEILDIVGVILCDPNVGPRNCQIQVLGHLVDPDQPGPLGPYNFLLTAAIVLAANQYGAFVMTSGISPGLVTNTNGAMAYLANEFLTPQRLNAGAVISQENDNFAVGVADVVEIGVHYRRVS